MGPLCRYKVKYASFCKAAAHHWLVGVNVTLAQDTQGNEQHETSHDGAWSCHETWRTHALLALEFDRIFWVTCLQCPVLQVAAQLEDAGGMTLSPKLPRGLM